MAPTFGVRPALASMFDTPLELSIHHLSPDEAVTVTCFVEYKLAGKFQSCAHYCADARGTVDMCVQPSLGGSYKGIKPMALLSYLKQSPGQRDGRRLLPRDVNDALTYTLSVFNGHRNLTDVLLPDTSSALCTVNLQRYFIHPEVERIEVNHGRIRGALFYPRNAPLKSLPAVLDLFGTGGGLIQHRSALLASHGFAAFAVAYFDYKDAPTLEEVSLEYFQECIDWLRAQPQVSTAGVGVIGVSFGAILAVLIGTHLKHVNSVIFVNGEAFTWDVHPIYFRGTKLPCIPLSDEDQAEYARLLSDPAPIEFMKARHQYESSVDSWVFPIEQTPSNTRYLMLCSEDDQSAGALDSARRLERRWVAAGRDPAHFSVLLYKGAGHLLEPPYVPHVRITLHKAFKKLTVWGGEPDAHCIAQERAWQSTLRFFRHTLGQPFNVRPFDQCVRQSIAAKL